MIKFHIVSRHMPGSTRERFYYEWAFVHVSLMLHTAPSMRRFRRYVQHFANPDLPDVDRLFPGPAEGWESVAEHWVERLDVGTPGAEYTEQMLPHKFSDTAMEVWYLRGEAIHVRAGFRPGGVKVFHRLARPPHVAEADWQHHLRAVHAPRLVGELSGRGLRKYEVNLPAQFDPAEFRERRKGTLLEHAAIDPPAAVEELWFDDLAAALQLGRDQPLRKRLLDSYEAFVDTTRCCSLVANERVVFDFASATEPSALPAVLVPGSLESTLFRNGRPYHEPRE